MKKEKNESGKENRRNFLKKSLMAGGTLAAGIIGIDRVISKEENTGTSKVVICQGKVYKTDSKNLKEYTQEPISNEEARKGIEGRKFVMVIDLAKCDGCKKCTDACQSMHLTEPDREWIKVFKMKDSETTSPYFLPKPCFHCDNPPCTKVCPVNATFKRQDGIVLIDNERCIGCRMCMAACPYSTRFFNWSHPVQNASITNEPYSAEKGYPRRMGTVEKCDFCPDMIRKGEMPACVTGCPMNVVYFGDQNENAVTNSSGTTLKLSQLLEDNAGYRLLDDLGTEPRVYYLPPKNRKYPTPEINPMDNEDANGHKNKKMDMDHMIL